MDTRRHKPAHPTKPRRKASVWLKLRCGWKEAVRRSLTVKPKSGGSPFGGLVGRHSHGGDFS
jgi:hypothetical protein